MRAILAVVIGAGALLAAAPAGAGAPVSLPYSCETGVPAIGTLSAPIDVLTATNPQPVDVFEKVTYTADLSLPDIAPQAFALNFNYFNVDIAVPPGLRAVKVKIQNPAAGAANPAVTEVSATVSDGMVQVNLPAVPAANKRFHFGTDGSFVYPFNTNTNQGGAPIVLPRIKITAMPTFAARGATVDWAAPEVETFTGFFNIGVIPCTPDDPGDVLFSSAVTTAVAIPANGYPDVPASLDAAVNWSKHLKVTTFPGTTYRPSQAITRAEAVQALWNMVDRPAATSQHTFTDAPRTAPYDAALDWAFSEGVVTDNGNHKFKPSNPALRGALVDMVFHMIEAEEGSPWPAEPYTDVASTAPYAEAMGWANATNTINEFAGGTQVKPTVAATRADLARILFKTAKNPTWFRPFPTTVLVAPA
ncbi:MAG: S-layer homology domain-containing protein [Acidimicrobiales bacterium]|nr:S-layer homology domain-containing protein [Acidimicrobiales bacterium]